MPTPPASLRLPDPATGVEQHDHSGHDATSHAHHHTHDDAHHHGHAEHPAHPHIQRREAFVPAFSFFALSAFQRLLLALPVIAILWLGVFWAMGMFE